MNFFQPQPVSPRSWRDWLRSGLELSTRQLLINLLLGGLFVAPMFFLQGKGFYLYEGYSLIILPIAFGLFSATAQLGDNATTYRELLQSLWPIFMKLIGLGIIFWSFFFAVIFIISSLMELINLLLSTIDMPTDTAEETEPAQKLVDFYHGHVLLVNLVFYLTTAPLWFISPLIACGKLNVLESIILGVKAFHMNQFLLTLAIASAVLSLGISIINGIWFFILTPIIAAIMYAAYRHVFLNKIENSPVKTKARTTHAVGAHH